MPENIMGNEATEFLSQTAFEEGFAVYTNLSGHIDFADSKDRVGAKTTIHLSSGAVYGFIAVVTDESDIDALFNEAGNAVEALDSNKTLYPLYWGRDINPGSRIAAHVRPRKDGGTGNAELEKIKALRNFKVIFGCVYVERYLQYEQLLHDKYTPLVGTPKTGKKLEFTVITN